MKLVVHLAGSNGIESRSVDSVLSVSWVSEKLSTEGTPERYEDFLVAHGKDRDVAHFRARDVVGYELID